MRRRTVLGAPRTVAENLNVPWALAFLPGGDALVSERETGRILRVPAGGGSVPADNPFAGSAVWTWGHRNVQGMAWDSAGGKYTNPLVTWHTDGASPSGAAILGDTPYVGALRGEAVWPVHLNGTTATVGDRLLHNAYGRIRAVAAAPDGWLWITTSNLDGRGNVNPGDDKIIAITV